jgi:hypothetical protein
MGGSGNHRLGSVLAGGTPFDGASAKTVVVASVHFGDELLLAHWCRRNSKGTGVEDR